MICGIIDFTVECVKLLIVLIGILNYRSAHLFTALATYVASVLILIGVYTIDAKYLSAVMALSIVVCGLFVDKHRRFLFSALSFLSICFIDDLLILLLRKSILGLSLNTYENTYSFCALNAMSILILAPIALCMQNCFYDKDNKSSVHMRQINSVYLFLLITGEFSALVYISPFSLSYYHESFRNNYIVLIGGCVLGLLFIIIGVLLLCSNSSNIRYKRLTEISKKTLEMQKKYYTMLLEKDNETRRFRHDISNHLLCINTLLNNNDVDSAVNYLTHLRRCVENMQCRIQTGNILINSIVNDLSEKYTDVDLRWQGRLPNTFQISDVDICVIFSNLLENAFCAAKNVSDGGYVEVVVRVLNSSITFSINNNISKPIKTVKNCLVSDKKDKRNHGIGIMNVRDSLKKYEGVLEYSYTDTAFFVNVIIPNVI